MTTMRRKRGTKRPFTECSTCVDSNSLPLKKQKQAAPDILHAIKNIKQCFQLTKLHLNQEYTRRAVDDDLFNRQPSYKQSKYTRWVVACKFIIAAKLRLDCYDVLGMNRTKIPENMHFYVDNEQNLCALIHDHGYNPISQNIVEHCNKIETSVVQTFHGMNEDPEYISKSVDSLCLFSDKIPQTYNDIITIIRIPMTYYTLNMRSSFYALCCRITKHLLQTQDFGHPLFGIFLKNIANFDCFQMSVPAIPLSGSLYQMLRQFGCGLARDEDMSNVRINQRELRAFVATYDCWNEMKRKEKCRKAMNKYWLRCTNIDVHVMHIVIQFADLHPMSDVAIMRHIRGFDEFKKYLPQLQPRIDWIHSSLFK